MEAEGSLGFEAAKGRQTIGMGRSRRAMGVESTKESFSDDGELQQRWRANVTTVKVAPASKSDDEQAKATSTANNLAATANDSARSS